MNLMYPILYYEIISNDYFIGIKKNQPNLYEQIEKIITDKTKQSSAFITLELNRGRSELRNTMVSNCIDGISKDWKGLQQIIGVHRIVIEKGKRREEMAYFISSRNDNAFLYEEGIRSHWEIENSLHWVKDVTFKEDESKIKMGNAPQNISTIKNIGINILRTNNYTNMAQAIRLVANDINLLYYMIF
jgi:predicted transposase YbfD/YdcC